MKKISLILLGVFGLLFSTNVFADSEWTGSPFSYMTITQSVYYDDDFQTNVEFETDTFYTSNFSNQDGSTYYNSFDIVNNCDIFGHYSNGNLIPCRRSRLVYNQTTAGSFRFYRFYDGTNTDPNTGEIHSYLDLINTRRIDFYDNIYSYSSLFRYDVSFKLDFYERRNNSYVNINGTSEANSIFNAIWVPTAYDNGVNCYSTYSNGTYKIDVSCSGVPVKDFHYSFDFRSIRDNTSLKGGVNGNYSYFVTITVSDASFLNIDSDRLEDLIMNNSPSGDTFGDYYKYIPLQGQSYFDKFNDFNFNGLSNVILAPLQFIRSLSTPYLDDDYTQNHKYSCSVDPLKLNMNIFGHNICIPSGHIFWNRGRDLWNINKSRMLSNFRNAWNVLLGGFIIYLLLVKLFKVCINAIDPTKEGVEHL